MKELLIDLGRLISLEQINRDELAHAVSIDRSNLISALKGRRALPATYLPSLRRVLNLDDDYRLLPGRVYGLWVKNGIKLKEDAMAVLRRFCTTPLNCLYYLRGIGEDGREGFAYVFEDGRGVLVAVRNDDALLAADEADSKKDGIPLGSGTALFVRSLDIAERETTMSRFCGLFGGSVTISEAECRAMARDDRKVWTWARLREKAERIGVDAIVAAEKLGLEAETAMLRREETEK